MKKTKLLIFAVYVSVSSFLVAQNSSIDAAAEEAHPITVGEYVAFLKTATEPKNTDELYSGAMASQILRASEAGHDDYSVAAGVSDDDLMLGLTQLEVKSYFNWVKSGSPTKQEEANSFTTPLMMFGGDEAESTTGKTSDSRAVAARGDARMGARTSSVDSSQIARSSTAGGVAENQSLSGNDKPSGVSISNTIQNRPTSLFASFFGLVHQSSTRFALALRASSGRLFPSFPTAGIFIHYLCTATLRIVNPMALANADWNKAIDIHNKAQQVKDKAEQTQTNDAFTELSVASRSASVAWATVLETKKSILSKVSEADKPALLADIKTAEERKKEHAASEVAALEKAKEARALAELNALKLVANADWEKALDIHDEAEQAKSEAERTQTEHTFTALADRNKTASLAWTTAIETKKALLSKSPEADKADLLADIKTAEERKKEHAASEITALQKAKEARVLAMSFSEICDFIGTFSLLKEPDEYDLRSGYLEKHPEYWYRLGEFSFFEKSPTDQSFIFNTAFDKGLKEKAELDQSAEICKQHYKEIEEAEVRIAEQAATAAKSNAESIANLNETENQNLCNIARAQARAAKEAWGKRELLLVQKLPTFGRLKTDETHESQYAKNQKLIWSLNEQRFEAESIGASAMQARKEGATALQQQKGLAAQKAWEKTINAYKSFLENAPKPFQTEAIKKELTEDLQRAEKQHKRFSSWGKGTAGFFDFFGGQSDESTSSTAQLPEIKKIEGRDDLIQKAKTVFIEAQNRALGAEIQLNSLKQYQLLAEYYRKAAAARVAGSHELCFDQGYSISPVIEELTLSNLLIKKADGVEQIDHQGLAALWRRVETIYHFHRSFFNDGGDIKDWSIQLIEKAEKIEGIAKHYFSTLWRILAEQHQYHAEYSLKYLEAQAVKNKGDEERYESDYYRISSSVEQLESHIVELEKEKHGYKKKTALPIVQEFFEQYQLVAECLTKARSALVKEKEEIAMLWNKKADQHQKSAKNLSMAIMWKGGADRLGKNDFHEDYKRNYQVANFNALVADCLKKSIETLGKVFQAEQAINHPLILLWKEVVKQYQQASSYYSEAAWEKETEGVSKSYHEARNKMAEQRLIVAECYKKAAEAKEAGKEQIGLFGKNILVSEAEEARTKADEFDQKIRRAESDEKSGNSSSSSSSWTLNDVIRYGTGAYHTGRYVHELSQSPEMQIDTLADILGMERPDRSGGASSYSDHLQNDDAIDTSDVGGSSSSSYGNSEYRPSSFALPAAYDEEPTAVQAPPSRPQVDRSQDYAARDAASALLTAKKAQRDNKKAELRENEEGLKGIKHTLLSSRGKHRQPFLAGQSMMSNQVNTNRRELNVLSDEVDAAQSKYDAASAALDD